jgi:hypothetical protein
MSDEYKGELARYDATARRQDMHWRACFDLFVHSDRATVDVGIGALKTAILVNAGALVTLLAFVGQVWNKDEGRKIASHILSASRPFIFGIVFGAVAFALAYIFQWLATRQVFTNLEEIYEKSVLVLPVKWTSRFALFIKTGDRRLGWMRYWSVYLGLPCGDRNFQGFCLTHFWWTCSAGRRAHARRTGRG